MREPDIDRARHPSPASSSQVCRQHATQPEPHAAAPSLGEALLTASQVAEYLGLHKATVYRLAGQPHGIPAVELCISNRSTSRKKGSVRFRPADVRAFVEEHLVSNAVTTGSRADRLLAAAQVAEKPTSSWTTPGSPRRRRRRGE